MNRGGQSSIEYLIITGFIILVPLSFLFFIQYGVLQHNMAQQQAESATQTIAQAVERVHAAGSPSRETVTVRVPAQASDFTVSETAVWLLMQQRRPYDVVAFTQSIFVADQTLNADQGVRRYTVQATPRGVVVS